MESEHPTKIKGDCIAKANGFREKMERADSETVQGDRVQVSYAFRYRATRQKLKKEGVLKVWFTAETMKSAEISY